MSTIIFEEVTKNYGRVQGISNVSLNIGPGVTGILGPNGAGKSTTMKVLLGLARPSIGSVYVDGVNPFDNFDLSELVIFNKFLSEFIHPARTPITVIIS